MNRFAVLAVAATALSTAALAGPFDQFKGRMKEGMYDYKIEMDMGQIPGLPAGMGKQNLNFQHCITAKDIDEGAFNKNRDGKRPSNCEIKNFKMSGNSATYTMECGGESHMVAENKITFVGSGFDMDMKMTMNRGGHPMNMVQHAQARYVGACTK